MTLNHRNIPEWNIDGLLPPFVGDPADTLGQSPYPALVTDLVLRLGDTVRRREILMGFLDFRAALHQAGLLQGFQWVNGSFVENIMQRENREPNDIDVVNFLQLPDGHTQTSILNAFPSIFDRTANKGIYHTDTLFVILDNSNMIFLANRIAYWNSFWSHTREGVRKGYLSIDLAADDDAAARAMLNEAVREDDAL